MEPIKEIKEKEAKKNKESLVTLSENSESLSEEQYTTLCKEYNKMLSNLQEQHKKNENLPFRNSLERIVVGTFWDVLCHRKHLKEQEKYWQWLPLNTLKNQSGDSPDSSGHPDTVFAAIEHKRASRSRSRLAYIVPEITKTTESFFKSFKDLFSKLPLQGPWEDIKKEAGNDNTSWSGKNFKTKNELEWRYKTIVSINGFITENKQLFRDFMISRGAPEKINTLIEAQKVYPEFPFMGHREGDIIKLRSSMSQKSMFYRLYDRQNKTEKILLENPAMFLGVSEYRISLRKTYKAQEKAMLEKFFCPQIAQWDPQKNYNHYNSNFLSITQKEIIDPKTKTTIEEYSNLIREGEIKHNPNGLNSFQPPGNSIMTLTGPLEEECDFAYWAQLKVFHQQPSGLNQGNYIYYSPGMEYYCLNNICPVEYICYDSGELIVYKQRWLLQNKIIEQNLPVFCYDLIKPGSGPISAQKFV